MVRSFPFLSLFLQCYVLFKRKVELRVFIDYYFVFLDVLHLGRFVQVGPNTNFAREEPHTPHVQRFYMSFLSLSKKFRTASVV